MTPHPTLGQRLTAWRILNGLSPADVGVSLHIEPGLVADIERGCIPGSAATQAAIEALIAPTPHTPLGDAAAAAFAEAIRLIKAGDAIEIVIRRVRSDQPLPDFDSKAEHDMEYKAWIADKKAGNQ